MKYLFFISALGFLLLVSCESKNTNSSEKNQTITNNIVVTTSGDNQALISISDETTLEKAKPLEINDHDTTITSGKENEISPEEKARRLELRRARTAFNNGMKFYKDGNYPEAIRMFKSVLENDANNAKAYFNLGKIYGMQGQPDLALAYYEDAIKYNPRDSASMVGIGMIYFNKGNFTEAVEYYNRSIAIAPGYSLAYYNRGTVLGQQKDYEGSISDLSMAIELDPKDHRAYLNRGLAHYYSKQMNKACSDWSKSAEMGNPEALKAMEIYCKEK